MADARSEMYFEQALKRAKFVLETKPVRDGKVEDVLLKYSQERDMYAYYRLAQLKGTRGRRGSAPSEQNHSSVLVHLNDGMKTVNDYCEQPHTLIKDLFVRQRFHVNKWNKDLFCEDLKMSVEVARLEQLPSTKMISDLIQAAKELNKRAYDMFHKSYLRSEQKLQMMTEYNKESGGPVICVRCIEYPESKPRIFKTIFDRCDCTTSVAHEAQCEHEIKLTGGYNPTYFQIRHKKRTQVKGSLNGWSFKTDKTVSRQIFSVDEDIDQTTTVCNEIAYRNHKEDEMDYEQDEGNTEYSKDSQQQEIMHDNPNIEIPDMFHKSCEDVGDAIKPLSLSNLKELLGNVSSNYGKCTEETKFIIGAIAVNLSKLSITEGNGTCEYDEITDIENVSSGTVMDVHKKCIRQYKSAFASKHGAFITKNRLPGNVLKPSDGNVRKQSKQRLKRSGEQAIQNKKKKITLKQHVAVSSNGSRVRVNQKTGGSCGFCGSRDTHSKITSCPTKNNYKALGREYEISSKENVSDIKTRIENFMPLTIGTPVGSMMKDVSQEQHRCHLVVHKAFPNYKGNALGHISIQDMSFRVSLIGKDGQISSSSSSMHLSGSCVESMLNKASDFKTVKRFLYDCTALDAEKNPSWRARTLQKCNYVNVNASKSGDRSNEYTAAFSQQCCTMNQNVSHNEYYGYLSQQSANTMSQTGFFNHGYYPNATINGNVHRPVVHTLPMPYNLPSISPSEFFTQEKLNENDE